MDELYEEGKAEGFTEGKIEEKIELIRGMLKHNLPSETIMDIAKITKDELAILSYR
jgi:predicted transposase/invertase (TIGR01784 family)